eukprot:TRINITY_DN27432_c0_g1_i1.p1 TRINITY_DN27432_c0_g1~~TRINITY_DN27432_c0_g1_i1.p1  ORF type:complete len:914 (+),score=318.33 TRINITY_DN27432_c0_g1_i1:46-2742(+)
MAEERRIDVQDGCPYSKREFVDHYRGTDEWEQAPPATYPEGTKVEVRGLGQRKELNGQTGVVVACGSDSKGKPVVKLRLADGSKIQLRPQNVAVPGSPKRPTKPTPKQKPPPQKPSDDSDDEGPSLGEVSQAVLGGTAAPASGAPPATSPKTGLRYATPSELPEGLRKHFGPLFREGEGGSAIYLVAPAAKSGGGGAKLQRVVVVADKAVYVCTTAGAVKRCVPIKAIAELCCTEDGWVGMAVPEQYDLALHVSPKAARDIASTLSVLHKGATGQDLTAVQTTRADLRKRLQTKKPPDWGATRVDVLPIATRWDEVAECREEERSQSDHSSPERPPPPSPPPDEEEKEEKEEEERKEEQKEEAQAAVRKGDGELEALRSELEASRRKLADADGLADDLRDAAAQAAESLRAAEHTSRAAVQRERLLDRELAERVDRIRVLESEIAALEELDRKLMGVRQERDRLIRDRAECVELLEMDSPPADGDGDARCMSAAVRALKQQRDDLQQANWRLTRERGELAKRAAASSRLKQPAAAQREEQVSPALDASLRGQRQAELHLERVTALLHKERQSHEETKLMNFELDASLTSLKHRHREQQEASQQIIRSLQRRVRVNEEATRPPFHVGCSPSQPSVRSVSTDAVPVPDYLAIGRRVSVLRTNVGLVTGVVRYWGSCAFAAGEWVGVELDEELGRNDGTVGGRRYFACPTGRGVFVRPEAIAAESAVCHRCRSSGAARRRQQQVVSVRRQMADYSEGEYLRRCVELREKLDDKDKELSQLADQLRSETQKRERLQAALANAQAQLCPRWGRRSQQPAPLLSHSPCAAPSLADSWHVDTAGSQSPRWSPRSPDSWHLVGMRKPWRPPSHTRSRSAPPRAGAGLRSPNPRGGPRITVSGASDG